MKSKKPYLTAETFVEGDETVDHETLFNDLMAGMEEAVEWAKGRNAGRVTILKDGEIVAGPENMTRADWQTHHNHLSAVASM